MRKRVITALCSVMLLTSALPAVVVQAQTEYEPVKTDLEQELGYIGIAPFWQNIASITIAPSFTNGKGVINGFVLGNPGTTRISVNVTLERVNPNGTTTHITSWNNLVGHSDMWMWEGVHFVTRGHNYRTTLQVTAVRNGVSETVTVSNTAWAD